MYGAQIAFRQYSPAFGIEGSPWVGLANFERFINSPKFEPVIVNTLVLSFYSLLVFPIPIILALSLNQVRDAPVSQQRSDDHLSRRYFISTVVIVGMLFQFLHPRVGFHGGAGAMHLGRMRAELDGRSGRSSAISSFGPASGRRLGFGAIIYLAVLSTIDPSLA